MLVRTVSSLALSLGLPSHSSPYFFLEKSTDGSFHNVKFLWCPSVPHHRPTVLLPTTIYPSPHLTWLPIFHRKEIMLFSKKSVETSKLMMKAMIKMTKWRIGIISVSHTTSQLTNGCYALCLSFTIAYAVSTSRSYVVKLKEQMVEGWLSEVWGG